MPPIHFSMNLALPEKKGSLLCFARGTGWYPECQSLQTLLKTAKIAMSLDSRIISATPSDNNDANDSSPCQAVNECKALK